MEQIFCDETGFTGPDLLNPDQKYFGYASVRMEAQEAFELVDQIRAKHPLQMPEWKGSKMLKTRRGREAALAVFDAVRHRSITTVVDKRFALAAKLFEYIFEPTIAAFSEPLYQAGFHKFVANLLYLHLRASASPIEDLLIDFQAGVRSNDLSKLTSALATPDSSEGAHQFADAITQYTRANAKVIEKEIAKTGISLHDKWGLDLTTTCLSGLLGLWADRDVALDLVLDDSKPLMDWWDEAKDLYEIRPGPSGLGLPEEYVTIEGTRSRVHFPLAAAPAFASSKVTPGLQIADVVASVVSDAFQHKELPPNQELLQAAVAVGAIDIKCVFPDSSYVDTTRPAVQANQQRLWELIYRSIKK
jgi:hypothetical protein